MTWTSRTTNKGLQPGGTANAYYWKISNNPYASYSNCLANCTTLAYGRVLENGQSAPTDFATYNAGNWHSHLANEWTAKRYSTYHSSIKAGDIIEWPGHVAVVESVVNGTAYCSSSLYTGDHGRAEWPVGSGNWDTRTPSVMGSTFSQMWKWFYDNDYGWRVYEYVSEDVITDRRMGGTQPTYILVNPNSPTPPTPPPTPTITPEIRISPTYYSSTMASGVNYLDFRYTITISGVPDGYRVSGGNTYPGLSRVQNTGWTYTDYTVSGVTYRYAVKTQTLRYEREGTGAYTTTKYMYYNLTFPNGSISSTTPMYITVQASEEDPDLIVLAERIFRRKKKTFTLFNR